MRRKKKKRIIATIIILMITVLILLIILLVMLLSGRKKQQPNIVSYNFQEIQEEPIILREPQKTEKPEKIVKVVTLKQTKPEKMPIIRKYMKRWFIVTGIYCLLMFISYLKRRITKSKASFRGQELSMLFILVTIFLAIRCSWITQSIIFGIIYTIILTIISIFIAGLGCVISTKKYS